MSLIQPDGMERFLSGLNNGLALCSSRLSQAKYPNYFLAFKSLLAQTYGLLDNQEDFHIMALDSELNITTLEINLGKNWFYPTKKLKFEEPIRLDFKGRDGYGLKLWLLKKTKEGYAWGNGKIRGYLPLSSEPTRVIKLDHSIDVGENTTITKPIYVPVMKGTMLDTWYPGWWNWGQA